MGKLSELMKSFVDKVKGLSKRNKIIIGICISAAIVLIICFSFSIKSNKYDVLFSNLDSSDSKIVLDKLKEQKVDYNVEGNTIYVPKDQADQLRLDLASEITGGTKGFELFDEENKWGMTDKEMDIKYQRALEGELERTITSLPQIEDAKVHLVPSDKSVFVKEGNPASASVTLNIKNDQDIKQEQVKAIVALLTGAVDNLPSNKVEIIDNKMRLLTEGLFDGEDEDLLFSNAAITATEKQQDLKKKYEKHLSDNLQNMLEKVYGPGKVKVSVNADLNFDANQQKSVTLDPEGVIISQKTVKDTSTSGARTDTTTGVTDNQLEANRYPDVGDEGEGSATHEEDIRNYEVSKVEDKTITAPGKVNRLTTSVVVDGNLDQESKNTLRNLVINSIGYDEGRGDSVSVEGMMFSTDLQEKAKRDLEDMNKRAEKLQKYKLYTGIGIAILALIVIFIILYRRNKRLEEEEMGMFVDHMEGFDVVIGDELDHKQPENEFDPVDFEPEEKEKLHIENEIKRYANEKPDQVADIVRAWIIKDEE